MHKEPIHDFVLDIILLTLIIVGSLLCVYTNNEIVWEDKYQNWEYNLNPSEGTGWIDAIVNKGEHYAE